MSFEDSPANVPPPEQPLDVRPEDKPPAVLSNEDRQWGMLAHLSAVVAMLLGGLSFLGPLIVWLMKKDESKFVDYHGKEALNFQINILIYNLVAIFITIITCGVAFPLPLALVIYGIVMPIIAGIKANEGKFYEYPLTFRILK
jgi:uncharacterized Tic20 family protein